MIATQDTIHTKQAVGSFGFFFDVSYFMLYSLFVLHVEREKTTGDEAVRLGCAKESTSAS